MRQGGTQFAVQIEQQYWSSLRLLLQPYTCCGWAWSPCRTILPFWRRFLWGASMDKRLICHFRLRLDRWGVVPQVFGVAGRCASWSGWKGPLKSRGERMSTNCFTICGSTMKSIGTTSTGEKVSTICSTARRLVPHPRPPRHQPPGGGHLPELGRTVHHALLSRPLPSSVSVELSGGSSRQGPLRRLAVHVS